MPVFTDEIPMEGLKGGEVGEETSTEVDTSADTSTETGGETEDGSQSGWKARIGDTEYTDKDLDKLAQDHEQAVKGLNAASREAAELKKQLEAIQKAAPTQNNNPSKDTEEEKRFIQEKYGFVDNQAVQQMLNAAVNTERVLSDLRSFVKEHNGADGMPKADLNQMAEFMDKHNMDSPEDAYMLLNRDKIKEAYARQAIENKQQPIVSERKGTNTAKVKQEEKPIRYNDEEARAKRRAEIIARHV